MDRFPSPEPFLDGYDLDGILALDDLPLLPDESDYLNPLGDPAQAHYKLHQAARRRDSYRHWLTQARTLAAAGVRVGPSHIHYEGFPHPTPWGAFYDWSTLRHHLAEVDSRWKHHDPLVLLGVITQPPHHDLLPLPERSDLYAVAAQSCGTACRHQHFVGIPLPLHDAGARRAHHVANFIARYQHHNCCNTHLSLTELADYHRHLAEVDLTAEYTWTHLSEAIYPLDRACLPDLTDLDIPDDILAPPLSGPSDGDPSDGDRVTSRPLAHLSDLWQRYEQLSRWAIYILDDNGD